MTALETKFGIFEFVILKLFRIFYCYCLIAEIIAMSFLVLKLTIQGLQALLTERQLTQLSTTTQDKFVALLNSVFLNKCT
ncbi:MAG: hypothetical protein QG591_1671 [Planctomycetota bacterium]|nr:hypothetical protein [Planctomycetota bacterium]